MTAASSSASLLSGWQQVLASEYAAVYGYGLVGVHVVDASQIAMARALQDAHRASRDGLQVQITAEGATPAAAQPFYTPPTPVADVSGAHRWALTLEQDCATAWRQLAVISAGALGLDPSRLATIRASAIAGLSAAATAASTWRVLLTPNDPTVAFPGL